ncbi:SDR family oxidoreductase [Sphingomonas sp. RRHST34]|uniref:SDR family oxidoreductase n=2 Tax=Sphingomonas citri TaxID=2862499 RepID=A0ABS7BTF4_9SPHN|nr:SDR family oxidoreductase [Sphingomonas citri]
MGRAPDLSDQIAVVTGGSRGIGSSIVRHLAERGASVFFTYSSSVEEAHRLETELTNDGLAGRAINADASSSSEVRGAIIRVAGSCGRINILINNAGFAAAGPIETYDLAILERMIAVHVRAPFVSIREALPFMPAGGRIVNVGSISSDYMPHVGQAAYSMTKAALKGLTRGLARELGSKGITINTVQPGRIDTDLLHEIYGSSFERAAQSMPLQRFGTTDEVADLVVYLCSSAAAYITGADIRIDGGVSA